MLTLGFLYFDPMYIIVVMLPGIIIAGIAQARVKTAYARASKIRAASGRTGAQAAAEIMQAGGAYDVNIEQSKGWLSDHYDPRKRVLRLSPEVYSGNSLASLGIAAHEAGHALQHSHGYAPLTVRNALVPAASIGSNFSYIAILIGMFLSMQELVLLGIGLFTVTVLFQLINLPCEFNASSRARDQLLTLSLVGPGEEIHVKRVLSAAAMTYVAAVITSLLTLLYFLWRSGLLGGRR